MIEKILPMFGVHRSGMLLSVASQVIRTFETEFKDDGDAKKAAIDAIIGALTHHKDTMVETPVVPPKT